MSTMADATSSEDRLQISPVDVLKTAHQFLVKWEAFDERAKLWQELQSATSELGKATGWVLPARLRLVGVIVQVVDALSKRSQAPSMIAAVDEWLKSVRRSQSLGKIDPLELLAELGSHMEMKGKNADSESAVPEFAELKDLEMELIAAARSISLHLEYQLLEKAVVSAVAVKEFDRARLLIDELDLTWRVQSKTEPPLGAGFDPSLRAPRVHELGKSGVSIGPETTKEDVVPEEDAIPEKAAHADDVTGDAEDMHAEDEATMQAEDVEDTLAAMMDMGAETCDEVTFVSSQASVEQERAQQVPSSGSRIEPGSPEVSFHPKSSLPQDEAPSLMRAEIPSVPASFLSPPRSPASSFMAKRKRAVLEEAIEGFSQDASPGNNASSAPATGNDLFDGPIVPQRQTRGQRSGPSASPSASLQDQFLQADADEFTKAKRRPWTLEEQERLIEGHRRYGNKWEHIRKKCGLMHRYGTQVRDKWVNLVKAGLVVDDD